MINRWHPVSGLEIVHIHRSEQGHPRLEWGASGQQAWALRMTGPRGLTPEGAVPAFHGGFEELVSAARSLMEPQPFFASAVHVDFDARRGHACGNFVVYGFDVGRVERLHDHSVLARYERSHGPLSAEQRAAADQFAGMVTSGIDERGLRVDSLDGSQQADPTSTLAHCAFSFRGWRSLIISSAPLHHDPHWPPASIADVPAVVLARQLREEVLILSWQDGVAHPPLGAPREPDARTHPSVVAGAPSRAPDHPARPERTIAIGERAAHDGPTPPGLPIVPGMNRDTPPARPSPGPHHAGASATAKSTPPGPAAAHASREHRRLLDGWTSDLDERWAVLRALIRHWHGLDLGEPEPMPERLRRFVDQLLMPPGESVCHWVRLCDQLLRRDDLWFRVLRDRWSGLADIEAGGIVEGVSLLATGEDDAHWLVSYADLFRQPDPPVHRYVLDYETSRFVHDGLVSPTVSEWALTYVLQNLHASGNHGFQGLDGRSIDEIAAPFAGRLDLSRCTLLEEQDMLVVIGHGPGQKVAAHARSPEAMQRLRERLAWVPSVSW